MRRMCNISSILHSAQFSDNIRIILYKRAVFFTHASWRACRDPVSHPLTIQKAGVALSHCAPTSSLPYTYTHIHLYTHASGRIYGHNALIRGRTPRRFITRRSAVREMIARRIKRRRRAGAQIYPRRSGTLMVNGFPESSRRWGDLPMIERTRAARC